MRITTIIYLFFLSLSGCSWHAPVSNAAIEQMEHHELTIEVSDNPEVCLACHDSQTGKKHHQIAMSYPPQGKEGLYLSVKSLTAKGGRLFKDKVVCTSCHNLKNQKPNHLVTENSNSRLCLLCHRI